jgi:uncharacterized protein (DUF1330 family)
MSDPVTLSVRLWAVKGEEAGLAEFENDVLALLPAHGGTLVSRVRASLDDDGPAEVHVITFRDLAAFDSYMADPRRVALLPRRDQVIARSEVQRLHIIT